MLNTSFFDISDVRSKEEYFRLLYHRQLRLNFQWNKMDLKAVLENQIGIYCFQLPRTIIGDRFLYYNVVNIM